MNTTSHKTSTSHPSDLPPEFCQYHDDGCDLAGSCLSCPFTRCVYDEPGGKGKLLKKLRDREIAQMFHSQKRAVRELAAMFGVSTRTVHRALHGRPNIPNVSGEEKQND